MVPNRLRLPLLSFEYDTRAHIFHSFNHLWVISGQILLLILMLQSPLLNPLKWQLFYTEYIDKLDVSLFDISAHNFEIYVPMVHAIRSFDPSLYMSTLSEISLKMLLYIRFYFVHVMHYDK